jgi:peptidoglycan/LPS O-acetylase OafA/YrhL
MKNSNIQLLRGISILLVIFTHLGVFIPNSRTFQLLHSFFDTSIGVDLFFIISGYLMGETFLKAIHNKALSSEDAIIFYKKRILRLYSPCFFWATVILLFSWIWLDLKYFKEFRQILGVFFGAITFTGNFYNATHPTVFGYFWSLGVEMQFYILLPLLVALTVRHRWFPCLILLLAFTAVPGGIKTWWMFRANGLFIGLLLWFFTQTTSCDSITKKLNQFPIIVVTTIFSLAIFSACYLSYPYKIFGGVAHTIIALILALAFFSVTFYEKPVLGPFSKPLEALGDISFSLYLCHLPIFLMTKYLLLDHITNHYFIAAMGILMAIISACLSYRFLERRSQKTRHNQIEPYR